MRHQHVQRAVIVYGPPGGGKGTQAELLAMRYGFIHFDTGRYIESVVHAPGAERDPILNRERKNYDAGRLCTPSWVLTIVSRAISRISASGASVVLSGSPRTMAETFGEAYATGKTKKLAGFIMVLEKHYGRKNISVMRLMVRPASSMKRNSARHICSVCGLPVLSDARAKQCSFCQGPLETRTDDHPRIIKSRLERYQNETVPVIQTLARLGYRIHKVNGEPAPYKVHAQIAKALGLK